MGNGIIKTMVFPVLVATMFVLVGISSASGLAYVSNAITTPIDFGQNAIYTISGISGGVLPYTFNAYVQSGPAGTPTTPIFLGSNTFAPSSTANAIILTVNTINTINANEISITAYNGVQSTANQLFANTVTVSNTIYGTWSFNAFFADSTGANTISSVNALTIDPALGTPTIYPSSATYDAGQTITLTASVSGGTPPYTYQWYNYTSGNAIAISGANSLTFTETAGSTAQTVKYYVKVTDSATSPTSANSATDSYTIDPALTVTSLTPSNTVLDSGQYVTYNVVVNGGTLPITANLVLVSNTIPISINGVAASPGKTYNTIVLGTGSAEPNTITFNSLSITTTSTTGGNVEFAVNAIDSASTPVILSLSNTITVNPAPSIALAVTPSNSITYGEAFTVNAVISGGTGNFLVVWTLNGNTITPTVVNAIATSNTITLPAAGTYAYEVAANDVGTTTNYVIPSATNTVVVSPNSLLAATVSGNPGTSYFEHTVSITFTGTPTINNQSLWYLYVNGALFGKTQSKITWSETEAPAGTYAFTFSNPGNSNYTANSISTKLVILYPPSGVSSVQQTTTTTVTTVSTTATTTIPAVIQVTGSSAKISKTISAALPVLINFTNEKAIINVYTTSSASVPVNVSVANVTSTAPAAPANYTLINALNVSISTNATISSNVTIAYPCSTPATSIAPFIYENGTWNPITKFFANPVTCTVSFAMPKDPIVGIFSKTVTTTVSTTLTTTQTTVPTTIPVTPAPSNSAAIALVVVIIIVIVIIVIAYYLTKSKKGRNR
ncbi:MAG: hypothetical protein QXS17_02895 [Candidatus Micrarchaeaceae archaeon]